MPRSPQAHPRPIPCGLDLFSGAGGLSLGFAAAGFRILAAVDNDPKAVGTLGANPLVAPPLILHRDLTELGPRELDHEIHQSSPRYRVDWVLGGPPCQGWSTVGRGKLKSLGLTSRDPFDEPRNRLFVSFLRQIAHFMPKAFVMENVRGMESYYGRNVAAELRTKMEGLGYRVSLSTLDCATLGLPQRRRRLVFVGLRDDLGQKFTLPNAPSKDLGLPNRIMTVRDAIRDLPYVPMASRRDPVRYTKPSDPSRYLQLLRPPWMNGSIDSHVTRWHRAQDIEAFRSLRAGGVYADLPARLKRYRDDIFRDKYHRLSWGAPSPCLTAHLAKDCYSHIHPSQSRTISVREAARVQGFPDWYSLNGSMGERFRQLGNSVPPIVSYTLASHLREVLDLRPNGSWTGLADAVGAEFP